MSRAPNPTTDRASRSPSRRVPADPYRQGLDRLCRLSIERPVDPSVAIYWDDPGLAIDRGDPRWELGHDDPLGSTWWYRSLDPEIRSAMGLDLVVAAMKTGVVFESILGQGLLQFAAALPNGAPELRYAYHEVIEESRHSLMFQEFVSRAGFDAAGLRGVERIAAGRVARLGATNPALFFVFVLGGEDPIDHVQRRELRSDRPLHPLLERIMRIHVAEEARHLSFARSYLRQHVPALDRSRRAQLAIGAPVILATMAHLMLAPSPQVVERYRIPPEVVLGAYSCNPAHRRDVLASIAGVRQLCAELGLITPRLRWWWRCVGLEPDDEPVAA